MPEPAGPTIDDFIRVIREWFADLREQLATAGIRIPPREDEDVTSLVQPVDPSTVDVKALKQRLRDREPGACTCSSVVPDKRGPLHATDCPMYATKLDLDRERLRSMRAPGYAVDDPDEQIGLMAWAFMWATVPSARDDPRHARPAGRTPNGEPDDDAEWFLDLQTGIVVDRNGRRVR